MASPRCDKCNKIYMSQQQLDHHKANAERLCRVPQRIATQSLADLLEEVGDKDISLLVLE